MRFPFEHCYNFELIVLIRIAYKKKNFDIDVKFIKLFYFKEINALYSNERFIL